MTFWCFCLPLSLWWIFQSSDGTSASGKDSWLWPEHRQPTKWLVNHYEPRGMNSWSGGKVVMGEKMRMTFEPSYWIKRVKNIFISDNWPASRCDPTDHSTPSHTVIFTSTCRLHVCIICWDSCVSNWFLWFFDRLMDHSFRRRHPASRSLPSAKRVRPLPPPTKRPIVWKLTNFNGTNFSSHHFPGLIPAPGEIMFFTGETIVLISLSIPGTCPTCNQQYFDLTTHFSSFHEIELPVAQQLALEVMTHGRILWKWCKRW